MALTPVIGLIAYLSSTSLTNSSYINDRYTEGVSNQTSSKAVSPLQYIESKEKEAQFKPKLPQKIEVHSKRDEENFDELPENIRVYRLEDFIKPKNVIQNYTEPIGAQKLSWHKLNSRLFQNHTDKRFHSFKKLGGKFTAKIYLTILKNEVYSSINVGIKELKVNCLNSFHKELVESPWQYINLNGSLLLKFKCDMDYQNGLSVVSDMDKLSCIVNMFFLENTDRIVTMLYCKLDRSRYTLISQDVLTSEQK